MDKKNMDKKLNFVGTIFRMLKNTMNQLGKLLKGGGGNVEAMSYGMFNNRSLFGYKSKVLKSGICKYYRREMFDRFEWCCMEMMIFGIGSVGLVTNVLNRLYILVMEEMCCDSENIVDAVLLLNSIRDETDLLEKLKKLKVFCSVVSKSKRARICSYVNNWWKHNSISCENDEDVVLDKVLKYKKKGDSNELLVLGERLIGYVENADDCLFSCYQKMYDYEKSGKRYRRRDGVYLYWEIIEAYFCKDENTCLLFKFGVGYV